MTDNATPTEISVLLSLGMKDDTGPNEVCHWLLDEATGLFVSLPFDGEAEELLGYLIGFGDWAEAAEATEVCCAFPACWQMPKEENMWFSDDFNKILEIASLRPREAQLAALNTL